MKKLIKDNKAQSLVEYILLISFISVVAFLFSKILSVMIIKIFKNLLFIFVAPIP